MCGPGARAGWGLISFAEQLLSRQDSLGRLIAVARRRLKQTVGRRVVGHGLSSQQFWVIVFLLEEDGPALCDVCDGLRMDPPTASRIVAALARTLHPLAHEFRAAVEKDLSRREALELRRLLEKVIAGLDRYEAEGA